MNANFMGVQNSMRMLHSAFLLSLCTPILSVAYSVYRITDEFLESTLMIPSNFISA
jgi:hypothetical protein